MERFATKRETADDLRAGALWVGQLFSLESTHWYLRMAATPLFKTGFRFPKCHPAPTK